MTNFRKACFYILSGTNGTGKSTLLVKFLAFNKRNLIIPANLYDTAWKKYKKIKPKKSFVLDPKDPKQKRKILKWTIPNLNSFKGTAVLDIREMEESDADPREIFKHICYKYVNGGLFVDDYKNYIHSSGLLPNYVTRIFRDRRHRMIDVFMASHSMSDINGEFLQFEPTFIVFKITRQLTASVKQKIGNYEELQKIINRTKRQYDSGNQHYCEKFVPNEIT
jgi:GTPase SAR1 family protein